MAFNLKGHIYVIGLIVVNKTLVAISLKGHIYVIGLIVVYKPNMGIPFELFRHPIEWIAINYSRLS